MRRGSNIGLVAALALGGVGYGIAPTVAERLAAVEPQPAPTVKRRREAAQPSSRWWQPRYRGTTTKRHTGAGGAGMHRAWKKRRASGRH